MSAFTDQGGAGLGGCGQHMLAPGAPYKVMSTG